MASPQSTVVGCGIYDESTYEFMYNRLFHVVVDTDRTAAQILSIMNKQKMSGEVTFLPLNKLQPPSATYPQAKVGLMVHEEQLYKPWAQQA